MIRLNKGAGYLVGIFLTLLVYMIGQLIFFTNTKNTTATICNITIGGSGYRTRIAHYYACFSTSDGDTVQADVGSNLTFAYGEAVPVVYKANDPSHARIKTFKTLWLVPGIYYIIPFAIILALVTGIYYGTKYVIISRRPWKIYLSNEEKEEDWVEAEVVETKFRMID